MSKSIIGFAAFLSTLVLALGQPAVAHAAGQTPEEPKVSGQFVMLCDSLPWFDVRVLLGCSKPWDQGAW